MTEHQHEPTPTSAGQIPELSFAERMLSIQAKSGIVGPELQAMFTIDPEGFEESLDELLDQVTSQDPEYQSVFSELKEARASSIGEKKASGLTVKLRSIRERLKEIVISELGLPSEARLNEIQRAHLNIKDIIESSIAHPQTPHEVFVALGIIEPREDGHDIFTFPYSLVPEAVGDKWDTYIATVLKHMQAQEDLSNDTPGISKEDVMSADTARRYAHDSVTSDVHAILALENLGMKWEWRDTRENLLARIRDTQLPTKGSALSPAAREFVKSHTDSVTVTEALTSRSLFHH